MVDMPLSGLFWQLGRRWRGVRYCLLYSAITVNSTIAVTITTIIPIASITTVTIITTMATTITTFTILIASITIFTSLLLI